MAFEPAGFIDSLTSERLVGWVWDPSPPELYVTAVIWAGRRKIAEVQALMPRNDLREAGIGDGRHGFEFAFQPPLSEAALASVRVTVKDSDVQLQMLPVATEEPSRPDWA